MQAACDVEVNRFLERVRLGEVPFVLPELPEGLPSALAARWEIDGVPAALTGCGTAGTRPDLVLSTPSEPRGLVLPGDELFANPLAGLNSAEWRFVLAHEMLHAGAAARQPAGRARPVPVECGR
jgi:hypothetical protein